MDECRFLSIGRLEFSVAHAPYNGYKGWLMPGRSSVQIALNRVQIAFKSRSNSVKMALECLAGVDDVAEVNHTSDLVLDLVGLKVVVTRQRQSIKGV